MDKHRNAQLDRPLTCAEALQLPSPCLREHNGIVVVRDDLLIGGTKTRYLPLLFDTCEEVVYASPCQGGAQTALAVVGRKMGKRVTIFVARRRIKHPRYHEAQRYGALMIELANGRLSYVEAMARRYVEQQAGRIKPLLGLRFPGAQDYLSSVAGMLPVAPDHVWCSIGSGLLASALKQAWPRAVVHGVAVGRNVPQSDAPGVEILRYPKPFDWTPRASVPFPCDPHYEAKTWEYCLRTRQRGTILFWNVMSAAP